MDIEKIKKLKDLTGKSLSDCNNALEKTDGDMERAIEILEGKRKKEKKIFKVGDVIICIKTDRGKLSDDCSEFLKTYKYFKVLNVNESLNIDIGYVTPDGKTFYFSPNRFELKDKPKEPPKIIQKDNDDSIKKYIDVTKYKYKRKQDYSNDDWWDEPFKP